MARGLSTVVLPAGWTVDDGRVDLPAGWSVETRGIDASEQGLSVEEIARRRNAAGQTPTPDPRDVAAESRRQDRLRGVQPYESTPEDRLVLNRIVEGTARTGEEAALVERQTRGERKHDYFANADAQPDSVRGVISYLGTVSHNLSPQQFPWLYHADGSRLSGQEIGDIVMRGHDRIDGMSPQQATLELFGHPATRPSRASETAALGQHTPPPAFQADPLNADLENPATGGAQRERQAYQDFGSSRPLTKEQRAAQRQQRDFNREVIQQRLSRFGEEGPHFAGGMGQYLMGVSQRFVGGMIGAVGTVLDDIGGVTGQDTSGANYLQRFGRYMGERGLQRETAATPNYQQYSPEWYAFNGTEAMAEMAVAFAGAAATKNPALISSTLMGLRVFGEQYDDSVRQGRTPNEALIDGTAYGMFEMIPENMALHEIWAPGQRFLGRTLKGVAAEGAQEMITEALQAGWDAGILNQQMTGRQALERVASAGLLGSIVGGPVGVVGHAREHIATRQAQVQEQAAQTDAAAVTALDPNKIDPSDPSNIASLRSRAGVETALPPHRPGLKEQAAATPPNITPEDQASPLPTELIAQGKKAADDALAGTRADQLLDQNIGHQTGDHVAVTIGGQTRTGKIADAFTEEDPETGQHHGAVIDWHDGTRSRERFSDLHDAGARIEPRVRDTGHRIAPDIVSYFVANGIREDVAHGIAAGVAAESGNNHGIVNSASGATGLGQWLGARLAELHRRYGANPTRQQQMEFLLYELRGGDAGGGAVLQSRNAGEALHNYVTRFMRPAAGAETEGDMHRGQSALQAAGDGVYSDAESAAGPTPDFSWIDRPVDQAGAPAAGEAAPTAPFTGTLEGDQGPAIGAEPTGDGTRAAPITATTIEHVDQAAANAAQPTEAQAEAGNYQKGHVRVQGLDITIETPRGAERSGTDPNGQPWSVTMPDHYGYVKRSNGADGEQVDVYVGPHVDSPSVYVIDQNHADTGQFDEHKAMIGYPNEEAARAAYHDAFSDGRGPERVGAITEMAMPQFKEWLGTEQTTPAAENAVDKNTPISVQPQPSAEIGQFDPAPHIAALREYVANRARSLSSQAVGKALGVAPEQAQRVIGALAAQPNSGIFVSKQGNVRRIPVREGPVSLYQFLKDRGGIVDNKDKAAGSRHALASGRNLTRFPGLINKGGMNLDDALEAAVEAGYFQTRDRQSYSTDDLLQKLENASREYIPGEQPEKKVDDSESVIRDTAETFDIELSPEEIEVARAYVREGDVPLTAIDRATQDRTVGLFAEIADATGIEEYRETDEGDKAQGPRASDQEAAQGEPRLAGAEEAAAGKPAADEKSDGAGEGAVATTAPQTAVAPENVDTNDPQIDAFGTQPGDERRALERAGEGRKKSAATQKAPGSEGGLFDQRDTTSDAFADVTRPADVSAKSENADTSTPIAKAKDALQQAMTALNEAENPVAPVAPDTAVPANDENVAEDQRKQSLLQRGPEIDRRTFIKGASAVAGGFMVGNRLFAQPPGLTSILERSMNEVVPLTEPLEWIANNSDNAQFRRFARRMVQLVNGIVVRGARQGETVHPDGTPVPEDMSEGLAHGMHQTDEVTDGDVIWLGRGELVNGFNESTVVHEALHAAIYRLFGRLSVRMGGNDPALLQREGFNRESSPRPASEAQITELHGLYQDSVTAFENMVQRGAFDAPSEQDRVRHLRNALGSPDEFLSWALENPDTQSFLRSQPARGGPAGQTLWDKIVAFIRRALGLGDTPRTALDDTLDTAYRLLADPAGPTSEPNDIVENPTVAEFNRGSTTGRSALQSSGGNNLFQNRPSATLWNDVLNRARDLTGAAKTIGARDKIAESFDNFRINFQDRVLPLLRTQTAIEQVIGRELTDEEQPYRQEALYTGRVGDQFEKLTDEIVEPMFEAMQDSKIDADELESYLYARHAPERNAKLQKEGVENGSGMSDIEAAAIMARIDKAGKMEALAGVAKWYDKLNAFALDTRVAGELMSQEQADAWRAAFPNYAPLKGHLELPEEERPNIGGRGFTVKGPESKRAFGRKSQATDIIAHSIVQAEEAVVRAEKNRVARELYNLAKANPDDNFWKVNAVTMKKRINEETGLSETYAVTNLTAEDAPVTVSLKVNGKAQRVTFNRHNPAALRAAAAMRRMNEPEFNVRALQVINQWLSRVNTMLSPDFIWRNALRDLETATANLSQFNMKGLRRDVLASYPKALAAAEKGAFKREDDSEWGQAWRDFNTEGARIYYNDVKSVDQLKKEIESRFARIRSSNLSPKEFGLKLWDGLKWMVGRIENANLGIENASRLSVYKNLVDRGVSKKQAAFIAREVTVNFTRRGVYGVLVNSAYLFMNASTQGNARMLMALKHRRTQKIAGSMIVAGAVVAMMNAALGGDDDDGVPWYDKISDYDKSTNLIFMIPGSGGRYIKIPMAYGYNIFPDLGRQLVDVFRGHTRPLDAASHWLFNALNSFNPIGGQESLANFIAPTVVDPAVDIFVDNRDYADRPIMPDQPAFGPHVPDSQRFWPSVPPYFRALTDALNRGTGGTQVEAGWIDVSPETLDYMAQAATGSAGATITRMGSAIGKMVDSDPETNVELNDIPVLRTMVGAKPSWYDRSAFYARLQSVQNIVQQDREYHRLGDREGLQRFVASHRDVLELHAAANQAQREMQHIRRAKAQAEIAYEVGRISRERYDQIRTAAAAREDRLFAAFNRVYLRSVQEPVQPQPQR